MDIHQSLSWKQVLIAVVALSAFGTFFTPIQYFVLTHPVVGFLILAGLIGSWFLYRKTRHSGLPT
ncbi:MAG: hypothetical protein HXX12_10450 [Geothrix sp.]|uniref:hypothetical protein n=1 Tax=Geothrix sp. TaxID=1962974 RepID=UPI0017A8948B|nr:hypothetical protein [Geothrix sp.]NWJ41378.1 hypothetical protein [Geothrix sp.]WIL20635.1 MAG: hypothetical protein QOZ81_003214 [Geothrix sp.]